MSQEPTNPREAEIDPTRLPRHIAIIMDGNGRWARARNQDRLFGHNEGGRALKAVATAADELGIRYLTVYGFSSENWRRPETEVNGLMDLILYWLRDCLDEIIEKRMRLRVIGRLDDLPTVLRAELESAMRVTQAYTRLTFTLALNYGGRAEVVDAVRAIAEKARRGEIAPDAIDEADIAAHLYAPDVPDPDLLIRTAGEQRLSNFLLWETAYSEIYVTPTCWPDFDREHLIAALAEYQKRTRKFGAVVE